MALRETNYQPLREIDVDELARMMKEPDVAIIDVREAWEFRRGHVPGAIPLPLSQFGLRVAEVPAGKRLAIICEHGNRSQAVAEFLSRQGRDAVSVRGGTTAWIHSRRPIE